MYLFSRRARLAPGNTRAAMTWATDITEKANQITELTVSAFTSTFSPEVGTVVWSTVAPDLASLEAANDKLLADDGYVVMIDEGSRLIQPGIDDTLLQIVHGDIDPNRRVEYAISVQAVCSSGNVARGMELGIDIAQRAQAITGIPSLFASGLTGPYGSVAWLSGFADIQEMERAQQALAADASLTKFIDDNVPGVYAEDFTLTRQLVYRRLA
jgi:hypothetical protein